MKRWTRHCLDSWVRSQGLSPLWGPVGDFYLPDICWIYDRADREQSRRFPECVGDHFLTRLVKEPTRGSKILELLFVNREGLVGDVKVGCRLGQSDHKMRDFSILAEARRGVSRSASRSGLVSSHS